MSLIPDDPGELSALAGEYALGTVDARTARAVAQEMTTNPELARLVHEFEAMLAPLSVLATPESPPADLWPRIEHAIGHAEAPRVARQPPRFLRLWQGWAIGATLAAIALAAFTLVPPAPRMMTVLVADAGQTAWMAEVDGKGGLKLAALSSPGGNTNDTAPAGKSLELWALAPGAKAPVSLGLVPRGGAQVSIPQPAVRPVPGMLIMISLEPPGGAPGGSPTGPVVFIGRLSEAGPPT